MKQVEVTKSRIVDVEYDKDRATMKLSCGHSKEMSTKNYFLCYRDKQRSGIPVMCIPCTERPLELRKSDTDQQSLDKLAKAFSFLK